MMCLSLFLLPFILLHVESIDAPVWIAQSGFRQFCELGSCSSRWDGDLFGLVCLGTAIKYRWISDGILILRVRSHVVDDQYIQHLSLNQIFWRNFQRKREMTNGEQHDFHSIKNDKIKNRNTTSWFLDTIFWNQVFSCRFSVLMYSSFSITFPVFYINELENTCSYRKFFSNFIDIEFVCAVCLHKTTI